jgi:hypothetical protein
MITYLKKKEVTDKVIVYNYSGNEDNIDGTVRLIRGDMETPPQFTPATGDEYLYFARQATFAIVGFIRNNEFPETHMRAIG